MGNDHFRQTSQNRISLLIVCFFPTLTSFDFPWDRESSVPQESIRRTERTSSSNEGKEKEPELIIKMLWVINQFLVTSDRAFTVLSIRERYLIYMGKKSFEIRKRSCGICV